MHDPIGPPAADTSRQARPAPAICPTCERQTRDGFDVREGNGVHQTSYKCPVSHIFIVRWAEVA